jgi:hypothetical protein
MTHCFSWYSYRPCTVNSLDAMQSNVLTKTYLAETPCRRPYRSWSRAPCTDTHRLSIQDGLTHRCVCRCLKSADFTSVTNVGNVSNCWIQNVLVNLRTRRAILFLQLFWIFHISNDYEQWLIFLRMQFPTTVVCRTLMWVEPSANALNPCLQVWVFFLWVKAAKPTLLLFPKSKPLLTAGH